MKGSSTASTLRNVVLGFAIALLASVTATVPQRANAQLAVVCANCSDIITQIMGYVEQLLQYSKQIQQYELQVREYENMIKNTTSIGRGYFDRALTIVRNVEGVLQRGTNISYAMANIDTQFRLKHPDYESVFNSVRYMTEADAINAHARRSQETRDAALTALEAAREQSIAMTGEQANLDSINGSLIGANGNLDAVQATAQYMQHAAQQLMKMRQIGLLQVQQQSQYMADVQRRQDLATAASRRWSEDKPDARRGSPNTASDYVR